MTRANINDRTTIQKIYGPDAWEHDAQRNAQGSASVVHGVTILSAPDQDGGFDLSPASRHVGEGDPESDDIFLPAFEPEAAAATSGSTYGGSVEPVADKHDAGDYEHFIDDILEAARNANFKPAIGKGDDRIKGFRGG
jgi:hypothetical protein